MKRNNEEEKEKREQEEGPRTRITQSVANQKIVVCLCVSRGGVGGWARGREEEGC